MDTGSPDDPRFDRALRLKAQGAEQLKLNYVASLWYLDIAESRRDVELVSDAIRGLERIYHQGEYDQATLVKGFLASEEITGLAVEQQAFVSYLQGLDSLRLGLVEWGREDFSLIPQQSSYYARSRFVLAIHLLAQGSFEESRKALEEILEYDDVPEDLLVDIKRTLARMAFEERDYREALEFYEQIRATAPDDPQLLLEMAWSHYYLGESRRALGLLVALDAPAYAGLIAPERFLLEALSLRRLCQFEPARKAAVRLKMRRGDALDDLHDGVPLLESEPLKAAARLRTGAISAAKFRASLEREQLLLEEMREELGDALYEEMSELYRRGLEEAKRHEDEVLAAEAEALAEELLKAEEGVRLIQHELGVALLRGRGKAGGFSSAQEEQGEEEGIVFYTFEGEFWTDELDDLVVTIEDRCID